MSCRPAKALHVHRRRRGPHRTLVIDALGVCNRQIFNVGSPANETSIRELAVRMREMYVRKHRRDGEPLPEVLDVPHQEFHGEGYEDSDRRIPDIGKARRLLGWEPRYDLCETLDLSIGLFRPIRPRQAGTGRHGAMVRAA